MKRCGSVLRKSFHYCAHASWSGLKHTENGHVSDGLRAPALFPGGDRLLEESLERTAAGRVLKFLEGADFYLANPLPGDLELLAQFLEGAG